MAKITEEQRNPNIIQTLNNYYNIKRISCFYEHFTKNCNLLKESLRKNIFTKRTSSYHPHYYHHKETYNMHSAVKTVQQSRIKHCQKLLKNILY